MTDLSVVYRRLDDLHPDPRNAKLHATDAVIESIDRYGFRVPLDIDTRTDLIAGGHGRVEALILMRQRGHATPAHIKTDEDGMWLVPVVEGGASTDDLDASGFNLALNRTQELEGYHQARLLTQLDDLNANAHDLFEELRYSSDDMDELLRRAGGSLDEDDGPGRADAPPPHGQDEDTPLDEFEDKTPPTPTICCPACGHRFERSL